MDYREALIPLLSLAACSVDRGACLSSHIEPPWVQFIPMTSCYNNSCTTTLTPIFHPEQEVCDTWEFPEGRPE